MGCELVASGAPQIMLAAHLLDPRLEDFNLEKLRTGDPWLLMHPHGDATWLGPLFIPGKTGCWACLAHRLRENNWSPSEEPWRCPEKDQPAQEIRRWLVDGRNPRLAGILLEYSSTGCRQHLLIRRPQCPACGVPRLPGNSRVVLRSRPRDRSASRIHTPGRTIRRLEGLVSGITGILPSVSQRDDQGPFSVWIGTHSRPLPVDWWSERIRPSPQPVMGKGVSSDDAKAGCLAEGVERYSIQWQGDEPRIRATAQELGDAAIDLSSLLLISEKQYRHRDQRNRRVGGFNWIPEPCPSGPIDWSPVWSLTQRRVKYVPTAYCYLYYPARYCLADSNGCAAGGVIEEAIVQGFMELVERDAVAIWWANRQARPRVVPDAEIPDAEISELCRATKRALRQRDRTLRVLDLTTDLGIPCFSAISAMRNGERILFGHGSHWNPAVAWKRAVSELHQMVEAAGEGLGPAHGRLTMVEAALRRWLRRANLNELPHLQGSGTRRLSSLVDQGLTDVRAEVDLCVKIAASKGLEVLVLNMTRPDLGFPVVRVIVPGLRHFWARHGPGRLYDVPVEMGWRDGPLKERELNPTAYFL